MPTFGFIQASLTSAKEKITSCASRVSDNYFVKAAWQGLAAPIYSYDALKIIWNNSEDVRSAVHGAWDLNKMYALQSFVPYLIYYRGLSPLFNWIYDSCSEGGIGSTVVSASVASIDFGLYNAMRAYLGVQLINNLLENFSYTLTVAISAPKVMPPAEDLKPCNCSSLEITRAGAESVIFYGANRYLTYLAANFIKQKFPSTLGSVASYALEAASFGWPLVEYKFSALGMCTTHRYKEIFFKNKTYCFFFGLAFVLATKPLNELIRLAVGEEDFFVEDAIFSYVFLVFVLISLARKDALPGDKLRSFDIVSMLKKIYEYHPVNLLLNKLFNIFTIEKIVKNRGVSLLLSVLADDITKKIEKIRAKLNSVEDIQNTKAFLVAQWMGFVPASIISFFEAIKNFSEKIFLFIEYCLELACDAQTQYNADKWSAKPHPVDQANHFNYTHDTVALSTVIEDDIFERESVLLLVPSIEVNQPIAIISNKPLVAKTVEEIPDKFPAMSAPTKIIEKVSDKISEKNAVSILEEKNTADKISAKVTDTLDKILEEGLRRASKKTIENDLRHASKQVSEKVPEKFSARVSERVSEKIPEKFSAYASEKVSEKIPEKFSAYASEKVSENKSQLFLSLEQQVNLPLKKTENPTAKVEPYILKESYFKNKKNELLLPGEDRFIDSYPKDASKVSYTAALVTQSRRR